MTQGMKKRGVGVEREERVGEADELCKQPPPPLPLSSE